MDIKLIISVVIIMTFGIFPNPGKSECCHPGLSIQTPGIIDKCGDNTFPTPYCGYGACNAFGCNCDGGCRRGKKREVNENNGFGTSDSDSDGKLSNKEALKLALKFLNYEEAQKEINKRDLDGDGFLSYDEADR